jgi:hypothetical protein
MSDIGLTRLLYTGELLVASSTFNDAPEHFDRGPVPSTAPGGYEQVAGIVSCTRTPGPSAQAAKPLPGIVSPIGDETQALFAGARPRAESYVFRLDPSAAHLVPADATAADKRTDGGDEP